MRLLYVEKNYHTGSRSLSTSSNEEKPNLRAAGRLPTDRRKKVAIGVCILAAIYMYPMIFKPLFGIGVDDYDEERANEVRERVDKYKPSFMPSWSSPFGPKPDR